MLQCFSGNPQYVITLVKSPTGVTLEIAPLVASSVANSLMAASIAVQSDVTRL